jgi:hypothetical protein
MKRAAVAALTLAFAVCMVHFYYAEDHCPVHCPNRGGQLGHVHDHHAGASCCLCFWASLFSPEPDDFDIPPERETPSSERIVTAAPALFGADIAHPPKALLA